MKHISEYNKRNSCCFLYKAHYPSCKRFKDNVHNDVHREATSREDIPSS